MVSFKELIDNMEKEKDSRPFVFQGRVSGQSYAANKKKNKLATVSFAFPFDVIGEDLFEMENYVFFIVAIPNDCYKEHLKNLEKTVKP